MCNQNSDDISMELRCVPDLLDRQYFIPEYQRGYRWESKQVRQLLNDLLLYFNRETTQGEFYCLQPVVVKPCTPASLPEEIRQGEWVEVIDGQQRLTTLRILCSIFDSIDNTPGFHRFTITYATRRDMEGIYDTLGASYDPAQRKYVMTVTGPRWNNLDSIYIYNAAQTIVDWFNEHPRRKSIFGSHLFNEREDKKSVQVVWYADGGTKDARDLFNELNDLTVRLSCSELIRSLFLASETDFCQHDSGSEELRKNECENFKRYICTKWDEIEHRLSQQQMLAFVSNRPDDSRRNNIEVLFDLMSKKRVGTEWSKQDPLYTFLYFVEEIEKSGARRVWQQVEQQFAMLCGWMENRDYYHKIGFLNAVEKDDSVMTDLLSYASSHRKREMMSEIDRRIASHIASPKRWTELSYLVQEDYTLMRKLLFLYNVELHRCNDTFGFFPFYKFKPLSDWTLEHIHAQNSDKLPSDERQVWIDWLSENISVLKEIRCREQEADKKDALLSELQSLKADLERKEKKTGFQTVCAYFDKVVDFYNHLNRAVTQESEREAEGDDSAADAMHSLTNMTLLSGDVNAAIGCSVFAVKREKIMEMHNNGMYFPVGTLSIFNKSLTPHPQLYSWSEADRKHYMESLKTTLSIYLAQ